MVQLETVNPIITIRCSNESVRQHVSSDHFGGFDTCEAKIIDFKGSMFVSSAEDCRLQHLTWLEFSLSRSFYQEPNYPQRCLPLQNKRTR